MQVIAHFLEAFRTRSLPQEQLMLAVRHLVLPLLEASLDAGQAILAPPSVQAMVSLMFDPPEEQSGEPLLQLVQWARSLPSPGFAQTGREAGAAAAAHAAHSPKP